MKIYERPQNKYLIPCKKGEHPPNPGAKKGIRRWASVFREIFALTPDEIKKRTGVELPEELNKAQMQEHLAAHAIDQARKGDSRIFDMIMKRMDGLPSQMIDLNVNETDIISLEDINPELRIEILEEMIQEAKKEILEKRLDRKKPKV